MDPLIRNLYKTEKIEPFLFKSQIANTLVGHKAWSYSDEIEIDCQIYFQSIQEVFWEYERLTRKSGLELNAEKTEILRIDF